MSFQQATAVPVQSVFADGAVRFVHVREGGKYVRKPVNLGRQSDTYAEILGGLSEGLTVLTREPSPSELLTRAWDKNELDQAGYATGEDGLPKRKGRHPVLDEAQDTALWEHWKAGVTERHIALDDELSMLGLTMDLAEAMTLPMSVVWAAIRNWIDQGLV